MAGVNQINLKYVNTKLEFLETLQSYINAAVADYINEVVSAGRAWVASSGDQETFLNISRRMENAINFLGFKCQEISEQHRGETSEENTPQKRQYLLKSATVFQPAPTLVAASQHGQTTESPPEKDLLHHQVLAKFGVIEEAIYSLRSNMEKVTEQQTETNERFENVTVKFSDLNRHINSLSVDYKQQKKRLKEHTEKITEKQAETQKQYESRIQILENIVKKLSTKQDKIEEKGCSRDNMNQELERKINDISEGIDTVKSKMSTLDAWCEKTGSSVEELLNRMVSQEQVSQFLCTKVDSNVETLETFSTSQERNVVILREFEDRLQVTETRMKEELEKVGDHFQETETCFKNLCQLIANRLKPLEELRSILNQRARTQDDNVRQLQEMVKEVAAISPKLAQLESEFTRSAVGFSAWAYVLDSDIVDSVITSYADSSCNYGHHFDFGTGIFTAPVAGTYVAFIRIFKSKYEYDINKDGKHRDNDLIIRVRHKRSGVNGCSKVCWCKIESHVMSFNACDLSLIELKAGDVMYAEVTEKTKRFVGHFTFSCFMIR